MRHSSLHSVNLSISLTNPTNQLTSCPRFVRQSFLCLISFQVDENMYITLIYDKVKPASDKDVQSFLYVLSTHLRNWKVFEKLSPSNPKWVWLRKLVIVIVFIERCPWSEQCNSHASQNARNRKKKLLPKKGKANFCKDSDWGHSFPDFPCVYGVGQSSSATHNRFYPIPVCVSCPLIHSSSDCEAVWDLDHVAALVQSCVERLWSRCSFRIFPHA